ncbi:MAG: DUF1080 domain-containing protein [Bacteroidota bacterium]|nr:DUF1080 domain-containing protein [Bacteroidota bacterium]
MKKYLLLPIAFLFLNIWGNFLKAQEQSIIPDLSKVENENTWTENNRVAVKKGEVHLKEQPGSELVALKNFTFSNGTIEVDIKGKDLQGQSFVGIAFHIENDSTYDAIYFRAFNFKNPERKNHAVQYISHPEFSWDKLRRENYGEYENAINPVPDPNDWFHATIEVAYPNVKVFINHAKEPALEVQQLSNQKQGLVGFWVPELSEGSFRNLKITLLKKELQ